MRTGPGVFAQVVLEAMVESVVYQEIVFDDRGGAADSRILDCNPAFTTMTGISREEAVGRCASELFGGSLPHLDLYARVAESGRPEQFETYYAPLERYLSVSVFSPRRGTFATIVSDITERDRTARLLRRYQLLAEHSRDIFLFVRPDDGRVVEANASAVAAYGYGREELLGLTVFDLREQASGGATAAQMVEADERGIRFETVHRRKDGSTFPVEVSSAGVAEHGARLLVSVVRDISERKRSEARLAAEHERLDVTLRSIGDAVIATDDRGRITLMNPVAEQLTGWPAGDSLGRPLDQVFRAVEEGTRRPASDPIERVLRRGEVIKMANHTALLARGGDERPIADSAAPIRDASGRTLGAVLVFRDQTAERHADKLRREGEVRLARSEQRYRLLAENVHDVIWTLDLVTRRFTYVSPSIERLRGLSVAEALAEPLERSLTAESLARARAKMAQIGTPEEENPHVGVYDQPCKDGTVKHVEITMAVIRGAAGRPVEVVGVSRDATARVQAERALADRERQLRSVLETALDAFWLVDEGGKFLEVNDAACTMSGYSREELRGMGVSDLEAAETADQVRAHIERIRAQGYDRFESRFRRKDGQIFDVEVSVRYAQLGAARLVCFLRDITDRKRAEDAVRRSEERFRALIERSSERIAMLDAQGRYTFWSGNAIETIGWTPGDIVGTSPLGYIHEADRPRVEAKLGRLLSRAGSTDSDVYRFQHKDGSWRHVESVARNLLHDPAVQAVVVNSRDVTAARALEEQFRQAQKLESVGRLAGGVAHDFNNLLTVILSCSEALQEKVDPRDAEARDDLDEIHAAGTRARDLTRQLLAFARKQVIAPVPLALNEAVARNQKMLARLLGEDVSLEVHLEPQPWTMYADPGQVEQVLMNLAVNARDAMPKGGSLIMRTGNVRVTEQDAGHDEGSRPGEWVELLVRDTGVGMPPEVQAHLFEPFFTTKEQGKGTGLGLATVYGIVSQAGGHIHVESEPGCGSTFRIRFPRSREATAPAPTIAPLRSTRGSERILVVEDDSLVRGVLVRVLTGSGYDITVIGHPRQALELAEDELRRVKLLVTDVVMPEIDGQALARELTLRHPCLRVLYLSGYTRDAISERSALDSGAEFLAKPFTRSALLEKVRAILDAS
ncbi:MAG TPA: PAS domain S-box protein [Anaeromyxobacter sp.]|nr:PAS domain S-box protein [Anaeromyxobacter sp.]